MFDPRYDPPRSARGTPQPDGIRWFFIYSAWTDIKGYPTDTVYTNQIATAQHAFWHPSRNEWIAGSQYVTLYDPSRTSQPAVGTLVRAAFNPANQRWEMWAPVSSSQNYVEYTLDSRLVGFKSSAGSSCVLDASNLTGWTGSTYRAGTETYIQYQTSETAPDTNGLYKVLADGLYRITLNGYWKLRGITEPSKGTQDVVVTGPASAGTAHTHNVTQTGHDDYLLTGKPHLRIDLYNKLASGGANALQTDAIGSFFQWQVQQPPTLTERYFPVMAQWNVCCHQNDKLSIKWVAAFMTNHEWTKDGDPLKLRFEYIGDIADWAAI